MQFMVVSRSVPGADRSGEADAEAEAIARLRAAGFFNQIYVEGDGRSAYCVVEAQSEMSVWETLRELPLLKAGCVEIEAVVQVSAKW